MRASSIIKASCSHLIVLCQASLREAKRQETIRHLDLHEAEQLAAKLEEEQQDRGQLAQQLQSSESRMQELLQALQEKEAELEAERERRELAQKVQELEREHAAALQQQQAQAQAPSDTMINHGIDPAIVAAQQAELQRVKDLLDEKNAENEELRRRAEARPDQVQEHIMALEGSFSLADELSAVSFAQESEMDARLQKLEDEARLRLAAEEKLKVGTSRAEMLCNR